MSFGIKRLMETAAAQRLFERPVELRPSGTCS